MKIGEVIDFLNQFNQKAEFKVVKPDGLPVNINKMILDGVHVVKVELRWML